MKKSLTILVFVGLFLSACSSFPLQSQPEPAATPAPVPVVERDDTIVVEGHFVPGQSAHLPFSASGQVAEVFVQEGDQVKKGDVLATLGDREQLEAAIASAKLELFNAQQALEDLSENLSEAQTEALQALVDAKKEVHDTQKEADRVSTPRSADQSDIDIARANLAIAKKALERATDEYEKVKNRPEDNLARATRLTQKAEAQQKYDAAKRKLNSLLGTSAPAFDVEHAQDELAVAKARLDLAQQRYDLLQNGPDPRDVAAAEERILAAEASLKSAEAALANLDLVATIDGTVVELNLTPGEFVSAGVSVVYLVDFSQWYVETDNLTEIDVVSVHTGQQVSIVPDAMPDTELTGVVDKISDTYEEKRGDITYTVRIRVENKAPELRWGMTVVNTFSRPAE